MRGGWYTQIVTALIQYLVILLRLELWLELWRKLMEKFIEWVCTDCACINMSDSCIACGSHNVEPLEQNDVKIPENQGPCLGT